MQLSTLQVGVRARCRSALRLAVVPVALFAGPARATAAHPVLLPAVVQVQYGSGALPLCSLAVPQGPGIDAGALAGVRALLTTRCEHATQPGVPLTMLQQEPGDSLPGMDDAANPHGRESYRIEINGGGVVLRARTSAGMFYATQTLRQMVEQDVTGPVLPYAEVEDAPALAYRGFMMDTAHGAAPTVAEIERQLDLLASWKANQYFFYAETNIDLRGYPLLHTESSYSAEDSAHVVEYARDRHIDVVPCVELYGHLHDLFRIERYSELSALPHGGEANPAEARLSGIFEDWVRQYAAMFPSKWFHLGFDEPFELERAGSKRAGGVSPDVLWLRHLKAMAALASSLGKRPLFWADIDEGAYIFNKYPGLAASLPKDAVAVPWFYDARAGYSDLLRLFRENHVPLVVASGISDWDNVAPDFATSFINIDGMLKAGKEAQALGLLNTMWSDSALALHRDADAAVAYGAAAAWQAGPIDRAGFFDIYARTTYGAEGVDVAAALASMARAESSLQEALGSETSFRMWDDPFEPKTLHRVRLKVEPLRSARLAAEDAEEHLLLAMNRMKGMKDEGELEALLVAARMVDYAGMKFLYAGEIAANFEALPEHPQTADLQYLLRREGTARNHSRVGDLIDLSGELAVQYEAEWKKEYKPYRMSTAMVRWAAEQEYWRGFQGRVWTATRNFTPGDVRPALQSTLGTH